MTPRIHFAPALLALIAAAAAFATALLTDAATAGLLLAGAGAIDMEKLAETIDGLGDAFQQFRTKSERRVELLETRLARPGLGITGGASAAPTVVKDSKGREHKLYARGTRIADHADRGTDLEDEGQSLASSVGGQILGRKNVARGPALVSTGLAGEIIDMVRDLAVISEAGAPTLVIDGPTNATRISGDPTVYQHTEGANDISSSDMTTEAVLLDPKALVCSIPLNAEAVEDSSNLEQALRISVAGAIAGKLNALCIATILANASVPKSTVAHACATWQGTMLAIGALMAAKQNLPTALICAASDFVARASQLASTGGSWLGKPPALASMVEHPTTAIAAGLAIHGGFAQGFLLAARQELRLEVVRFADPGRYSHLLVCHARIDGVVTQPGRLFIQKLVP